MLRLRLINIEKENSMGFKMTKPTFGKTPLEMHSPFKGYNEAQTYQESISGPDMKTLTTLRKRYPKGSVKYNEIQNQINTAYAGGTKEATEKYGDKGIRREEYISDEEKYGQLELNPGTEEFEPTYEDVKPETVPTIPENTPQTGYTSVEESLDAITPEPSEEEQERTDLYTKWQNAKNPVVKKALKIRLNRKMKKAGLEKI